MKNNSKIDKLLMSRTFYIIITLLFIFAFGLIFKWNKEIYLFNDEYIVDNELLGTYGDFIGGVLGTIFALISILILIRTFNQQKTVTEKNEEQIENQRFNDLFFELLRLYQSEISELCGTIHRERSNERIIINYNNKDFFDFEKELLQRAFRPMRSYESNIKEGIKLYMLFYIKNRTKVSACFRTLYRIYDLLDNANLKESVKKNYLKILRAQLTDSELFFIRYNGMTYYGEKFVNYINKYNILKHLPTFDLLEFKDWWTILDKVERMGINIVFHNSTRLLKRILLKNDSDFLFKASDRNLKYSFEIRTKRNYEVDITLRIDNSRINNVMEYRGFEKFTNKKLQALLDCFLKETFIYSNFQKFNKRQDLDFYSNPIITQGNICIIHSGIRNKQKLPLKIKNN
ncbi:MAG: hypothetical protein J1E16_08500 [Muribaculaceae bacterium]|nr:hypothetical protein [Muribaculaceae bacterium]